MNKPTLSQSQAETTTELGWRAKTLILLMVVIASATCQAPAWNDTPVYAAINLLASVSLVTMAVVLWGRPHLKPLAYGCFAGGILWSLQWVSTWDRGPLPVIGLLAGPWIYASLGIGFVLSTQAGSTSTVNRWFVRGFVLAATLQVTGLCVSRPEWSGYRPGVWWPSFTSNHQFFDVLIDMFTAIWAILSLCFSVIGVRHICRIRSMDRIFIVPVFVGFCVAGLVSGFTSGVQPYTPAKQNGFYCLLALIMLSIPLGFITSLIRQFVKKAILTDQLSRRLSRQVLTGDVIRNEFRDLLDEPSLELYYWSERDSVFIDSSGRQVDSAGLRKAGFFAELTDRTGIPLAVVVGDEMLTDHAPMLQSFLAASAIAIENVQLQATVKAQLEQVQASRARILEATMEERRRIERDLHDGVQQRLLALQARVGTFRRANNAITDELLQELSDELRATLTSLRELSQGIHPSELRQFGLRGAIEVVAERLPLDVKVEIIDQRFSTALESTLYFVICEALSNVVKHANATEAAVMVDVTDDRIQLRIEDNGTGGAVMQPGGGLEGLADRLRVIGADLQLSTSDATGTQLAAMCPMTAAESAQGVGQ